MKVYALLTYRKDGKDAALIRSEEDLRGFSGVTRIAVLEALIFIGELIVGKCKEPHKTYIYNHEEYLMFTKIRTDGLGLILVTDLEYPIKPAFKVLERIAEELPIIEPNAISEGEILIQKHPSPRDIFRELTETTEKVKEIPKEQEPIKTKGRLRRFLDRLFRRRRTWRQITTWILD